jgi:hypothetical protein
MLAHSGLLVEISGQTTLVEYMDSGVVNQIPVAALNELKASLDLPTDCTFLTPENCEEKNQLRQACKNDQNCFEFQNYLWQK